MSRSSTNYRARVGVCKRLSSGWRKARASSRLMMSSWGRSLATNCSRLDRRQDNLRLTNNTLDRSIERPQNTPFTESKLENGMPTVANNTNVHRFE